MMDMILFFRLKQILGILLKGVAHRAYIIASKLPPRDWTVSNAFLRSLGREYPLVFDIGCGDGARIAFHRYLLEEVAGVDLNNKGLKLAASKGIQTVEAMGESLPFRSNCFDLVTSFHVLEHIEDAESMINESFRVLKVNGYALIITPNRIRLSSRMLNILSSPYKNKYPMNPDHVQEYTFMELASLANVSNYKGFLKIIPFGLLRLPVSLSFLQNWCDQLALILFKGIQ